MSSTRIITASRESLGKFTREELRDFARRIGVERGRNKKDTIANLLQSGKANLRATLDQ